MPRLRQCSSGDSQGKLDECRKQVAFLLDQGDGLCRRVSRTPPLSCLREAKWDVALLLGLQRAQRYHAAVDGAAATRRLAR